MSLKSAVHKPAAHTPAAPSPAVRPPHVQLLDRDQSIIAFNARVLDWARRNDVPLIERLRYLCIVSSNLDEFFEVRGEPVVAVLRGDARAGYDAQRASGIVNASHALVERQYQLFNDEIIPAFARHGIDLVSHGDRTAQQRKWVRDYFRREVTPLLMPVGLDPAHPFPQVANKSLNFIVRIAGKDAFGRDNEIAIVRVPRVLPRLIRMPSKALGQRSLFVSLSSVIRAHLHELFPGRSVVEFSQFRVTRHSDLAVDEDDVKNLRTALRQGLEQRHYGAAVRLEVSSGCSDFLSGFLLRQFELPAQALFRVHGPVNLVRFAQLADLVELPGLRFPPHQPCYPRQLQHGEDLFARLQQGDVLIHQPFESFDGVIDLLRAAVADPAVLSIRQTIYRTGSDAVMMDLLREAVRRCKEVTAVVELKARFDEETNINWAEQLEAIGAQVVYGVVGLKTHAKMLLITRREGARLRRYGHLSTGNYNPRTARLYTDISMLTADLALTADMDAVFVHLAGQSRLPRMRKLLVAPFQLHTRMLGMIQEVGKAAAQGRDSRIIVKMNALTDEPLIRALLAAGALGAKIDLIVRGACMLPAQVPGQSDNIRVRSIIGRFLEHSRVFYFRMDAQEQVYLSSADWMNRNMLRRVEIAWPIDDPQLRLRVIEECLTGALQDGRDAWTLHADGTYKRVDQAAGHSLQQALMNRYAVRVPAARVR